MDLSWTCQIILDAQGTYRHPAPAIRETSDADLLSPVFLPAPPGVCESRAETIVQPELSAATNATSSSAMMLHAPSAHSLCLGYNSCQQIPLNDSSLPYDVLMNSSIGS
jgi:hypothetical protein